MQKESLYVCRVASGGGARGGLREEESQSCPLYCLLTHLLGGGLSAQIQLFQQGGNDDAFKGERVIGGR